MLFLKEKDIENLLSMRETVDAVEKAFDALGRGMAAMPDRSTLMLNSGSISCMSAWIRGAGMVSSKIVSMFPDNINHNLPTIMATVIVNDENTGKVLAVMDGTYLTALRTGAVSGVATRYLSRKDARTVGLIGCGFQGRTQLWSICEVREITKAKVYDIRLREKNAFAVDMSKKLGIDIVPVESPEVAVKDVDVIATATTSQTPIVKGAWISNGTHINAIGSFYPHRRELDTETIQKSKVVVDLKEAALAEAGDIIIPIKEGAITKDHIYAELSQIVTHEKMARTSYDEVTLFKAVGLAIEDLAAAKLVIEKVMRQKADARVRRVI
jgi:ornithine cyclodeaminase/alanine dehydrogenase